MKFEVRELGKAKADKRQIFEWLNHRSRAGAIAWLAAYDKMIERLAENADACGAAFENPKLEMEVKQTLLANRHHTLLSFQGSWRLLPWNSLSSRLCLVNALK